MKLDSAIPQAEPSLTEKEFLQMENQFLQDELEFQELYHSLELIETIKDCIRKEDRVSSSLESMFGENWSDKSVALKDLEKAEEGLLDFFRKGVNIAAQTARYATVDRMIQTTREKIEKIKKADLTKVKYPFEYHDRCYGSKVAALQGLGDVLVMDLASSIKTKTRDDIKSRLAKEKEVHDTKLKPQRERPLTITSPEDLEQTLNIIFQFTARAYVSREKKRIQEALDNVLKITKSEKDPLYVLCFRILHAELRADIYNSFKAVNSIYSHVFENKDS